MTLIYEEASVYYMYKFEAQNKTKDQASKAMHSTHSYRLAFNVVEWDSQLPGSNNQKMLNGFLDLESFTPWFLNHFL